MKVSIRASKLEEIRAKFRPFSVKRPRQVDAFVLRERNCLFDIDVYQRIQNVARNGRYISRV